MINDTTYATIDPAPESGLAWRVKRLHHLTGDENRGKRNIFCSVYQAGTLVRDGSVRIVWGWEGQHPWEMAYPAICNKTDPGYCADIEIDPGQKIWLMVDDGKGTPSDTVRGVESSMAGDGDGNREFHNSTAVTFEITIIAPPVIDNPPTIPTTGTWQEALAELAHRIKLIEDVINAKG